VKEDEMGRACGTNGGEEECMQDFGGKARRKEIHVGGWTILKEILKK
jgi:hypothetical protein